jgi:hypothetical protein
VSGCPAQGFEWSPGQILFIWPGNLSSHSLSGKDTVENSLYAESWLHFLAILRSSLWVVVKKKMEHSNHPQAPGSTQEHLRHWQQETSPTFSMELCWEFGMNLARSCIHSDYLNLESMGTLAGPRYSQFLGKGHVTFLCVTVITNCNDRKTDNRVIEK